jgi:hypothetical protein
VSEANRINIEQFITLLDKSIEVLGETVQRGEFEPLVIDKFREILEGFRKERLMLQSMSLSAQDLVPLSKVAKHVKVSVATVNRAARLNHLQAVKLGKYWYSTIAEGERWKDQDFRKHFDGED